jgi:hypothetical protein
LVTVLFAESETLYPPLESVIATFVAFAGVERASVPEAVVVPALENDEFLVITLNQYVVPAEKLPVMLVPLTPDHPRVAGLLVVP